MLDILHRTGVQGVSPDQVYGALTTCAGLAGWWTAKTSGESASIGGVIEFRFGPGGIDTEVVELEPNRRVVWRVVAGPEEWIDTLISFDLSQNDDGWSIILFKHAGWPEVSDFMHHCSTKWAMFLLSLKSMLETGKGTPWPNEVRLDSWES